MIVNVKNSWQGKVAIRSIYIDKAKRNKEDIIIKVGKDEMLLPQSRFTPLWSREVFDKFSPNKQELYYYEWKPKDERQGELL